MLGHSKGQGNTTMEWGRFAGKQFTYTSNGLGTLRVSDASGAGSHITGAVLEMPDYTKSRQSE
jgi:hypothetical protein